MSAVGQEKHQPEKWVSARIAAGFCAVFGVSFAGPSNAQVWDIGADGSVAVHAGPVATTAGGKTPILSAPADKSPMVRASRSATVDAIRASAIQHNLSPELVEAVAWQESRLNQNAVSPKGAQGVMQLMPDTARQLGVNPHNLHGNIEGGTAYLAQMMQRFSSDLVLSLAAYNAGPGAVDRFGGIPPYRETNAFVGAVLDRLATGKTTTLSTTEASP